MPHRANLLRSSVRPAAARARCCASWPGSLPQDLFVPGLASFLLAHVAYVVGLSLEGSTPAGLAIGIVVVVAALAIIGRPILRAVRTGDERALVGLGFFGDKRAALEREKSWKPE